MSSLLRLRGLVPFLLHTTTPTSAAGHGTNNINFHRKEVASRSTDDSSSATTAYETAASSSYLAASSTKTIIVIIGVFFLASILGAVGLYYIRRRQNQLHRGRYQAPLLAKRLLVSSPLSSEASLSSAFPSPLPPPPPPMNPMGRLGRGTEGPMELQERHLGGEGGWVKFTPTKDRVPTPWPFHRPFGNISAVSPSLSPSPSPSPIPGYSCAARRLVLTGRRPSIASSLRVVIDGSDQEELPSPPLPQRLPSKARFDEAMVRWKATSSIRRGRPVHAVPKLGLDAGNASLLLPPPPEPRAASRGDWEAAFQARGIRLEDLEEAARVQKSYSSDADGERSREARAGGRGPDSACSAADASTTSTLGSHDAE